jgi:hypothetical protein
MNIQSGKKYGLIANVNPAYFNTVPLRNFFSLHFLGVSCKEETPISFGISLTHSQAAIFF